MGPPIMPSCWMLEVNTLDMAWGGRAAPHLHECSEAFLFEVPDVVAHAHGGLCDVVSTQVVMVLQGGSRSRMMQIMEFAKANA